MVPDGWVKRTLGDFCTQISERAGRRNLPVLSVSKDLGIVLQSEKFKKRVASADISNYKCIRHGQFAYDPMLLWAGNVGRQLRVDAGVVSPAYTVFDVADIHPPFLERVLKDPRMLGAYRNVSRGTNVRRQKVLFSDFASISILLPPVLEQQKIASMLSAVDEVIMKTEAVIESLQTLKKAAIEALLTRGLPRRHVRFKQTEIGEIPEEWRLTTPGHIARFSGGHGFRPPDWSTTGLPIIRIQNLNGSADFNYFDGTPEQEWIVEPGELLFAWAGSIGASFGPCLWSGPRGVLNQHIYRVTPGPDVNRHYFYFQLKLLTAEVEKRAHGFKQTLVHLKKAELTDCAIALPPPEEQREIVGRLVAIENRTLAERTVLAAQEATKAALTSALLTGSLRFTPDENVE